MSESPWENRRHDDRIAKDTDQAEMVAIRYGTCNFEAGTFDDRIADAMDDYEVPDPHPAGLARWATDDIKFESATSEIGLEVARRMNLLGPHYPFQKDGNRIIYVQSNTLVYEFCLAVSLARSLSEGDYSRLPIAFERLVRDALICYLGPGADGYRTGWPADIHETRPTRFKGVMNDLRQKTEEFIWAPQAGCPDDPDPQDVKDEGLDVVVWKAIPDNRGGKLFLLGQCACGDNYQTKQNDIDADFSRLKKWLNPLCWASPLRVFSTPRHIPNNHYFRDLNRTAGLTLDRIRLTLLAEQEIHREFIRLGAKDPLDGLIAIVITGFQAAQPTQMRPRKTKAVAPRSQSHETATAQNMNRKSVD